MDAGGCPFTPSSCDCPYGTQFKRCAGALCEKCVCANDQDPGACLDGNGGGGILAGLKIIRMAQKGIMMCQT